MHADCHHEAIPGATTAPGAPLDRYASRVTPHRPVFRHLRHELRAYAGQLLPRERVRTCGQKPNAATVDLAIRDGAAYFVGVETCGSVWHCPVCAPKIAEPRRQEVEIALDGHIGAGGSVYLMALTVPHQVFDRAQDLRKVVAATWRKVQAGAPWKRAAGKVRLVGSIRALEVTHGGNGWHPHLHVVLMIGAGATAEQIEQFGFWIFERWARFIAKAGLGECSRTAFSFEKAEKIKGAGDYVAKWGCDEELTKGYLKRGRSGGRTPWQLLSDAKDGDRRARRLFQEYAAAFKGARQLTWSRGLKDRFGVEDRPDEELAEEMPVQVERLGTFSKHVFRQIVDRGLTAEVLSTAETGGWRAVLLMLTRNGVFFYGKAPTVGRSGAPPGGIGREQWLFAAGEGAWRDQGGVGKYSRDLANAATS